MKRMVVLAKVLLAVLGLYGVYNSLKYVGTFLYLMVSVQMEWHTYVENRPVFLTALAAYILVGGLTVWFIYELLFRGEKWAKKIVGKSEDMEIVEPAKGISDIALYYRLAFVCCGVLMLFWAISPLFQYIFQYWYTETTGMRDSYWWQQRMVEIVTGVLRLGAGIYFIMGAPHLMRWHERKIGKKEMSRSQEIGGRRMTN